MDHLNLSFMPLALSLWVPYLLRLLYSLGLMVIASWGKREQRHRGWRLILMSGELNLVGQLIWAYPTYLLTTGSVAAYAHVAMWFSAVQYVLAPVSACLLLFGLFSLLAEGRGGAPEGPRPRFN